MTESTARAHLGWLNFWCIRFIFRIGATEALDAQASNRIATVDASGEGRVAATMVEDLGPVATEVTGLADPWLSPKSRVAGGAPYLRIVATGERAISPRIDYTRREVTRSSPRLELLMGRSA